MTTQWGVLKKRIEAVAEEVDWEAVYREELPRIYNFFRYRLGDESVAEDLTATTFARAWQARQRYRRDLGSFSVWLFTIARRLAIDYLRTHRQERSLEANPNLTDGHSAEEVAQRRQDLARLRALLERLPAREQELVALKYGGGLTNRVIARLTGLSESNVGTILYRVVQKLRAEWEEEP